MVSADGSLPGTGPLSNVNSPYIKVTCSLFSELILCLQFLKMILMPRRHILEWHILLPFTNVRQRVNWEETRFLHPAD